MTFAALIPFALMLVCFVGLRLPLTTSSFVALFSGSLLTQFLYQASSTVWSIAFIRTIEITVEIGFILFGAFFFLEVARKVGVIDSFARMIKEVSSSRLIQATLVTFPLELLVEGSSGFGTPLLVIGPLLYALGFEIGLCALLPFLNFVVGIPFGALGTPIRLGISSGIDPSHGVVLLLMPLVFVSPLLTARLIAPKISPKEISWILSLSLVYGITAFYVSKSGPEFSALAPAFVTFIYSVISARWYFPEYSKQKIKDKKGLVIYGALLFAMWLGKQLFMDRVIFQTHIRIFNPGFVFVAFGLLLMLYYRTPKPMMLARDTLNRAKRTLFVFFCMSFVVQQVRENGGLALMTSSIPSLLTHELSPYLGWMGSLLVGTSTVSNLLFSKVVDPVQIVAIASGSAVGVQLAFQSLVAMKSALHDQISEKELFFKIAPISVGFITLVALTYPLMNWLAVH